LLFEPARELLKSRRRIFEGVGSYLGFIAQQRNVHFRFANVNTENSFHTRSLKKNIIDRTDKRGLSSRRPKILFDLSMLRRDAVLCCGLEAQVLNRRFPAAIQRPASLSLNDRRTGPANVSVLKKTSCFAQKSQRFPDGTSPSDLASIVEKNYKPVPATW
jgi:hypothetical protein